MVISSKRDVMCLGLVSGLSLFLLSGWSAREVRGQDAGVLTLSSDKVAEEPVEEWGIGQCRQELAAVLQRIEDVSKKGLFDARKEIERKKKDVVESNPEFQKLQAEADALHKQWVDKLAELNKKIGESPEVQPLQKKQDGLGDEYRRLVVREARVRNRLKLLEVIEREKKKIQEDEAHGKAENAAKSGI